MTARDRTDPAYWDACHKEFQQYAARPIRHFKRYARRVVGDFMEVPNARQGTSGSPDKPAVGNMTSLATRVALGDLYFRNPTAISRCPGAFNRSLFTPLLCKIESVLMNDTAEETNLFIEGRECLQDGLIAPYFVAKVMFDRDMGMDGAMIRAERERAMLEDERFLAFGVKPVVKEEDYDPAHIEQHEATVAAMQRGDVPATPGAIKYLQKHIQKHREKAPWCRVAETMRNQSVHIRRVNPLNYSFDPFNKAQRDREWSGEDFIKRLDDVASNKSYSEKARKALVPVVGLFATDDEGTFGQHAFSASPEPHVRLRERIDFVNNKVILYAEGGTVPLDVQDYTWADILPGGPYVERSFLTDPLNNFGVCIPYLYEAHQEALSTMHGVNSETVMRGSPKTWVNPNLVDVETKGKMAEFVIADVVALRNVPPDMLDPGKHAMGQVEPCEVPAQNVMFVAGEKKWIETVTGLGSAKLLAGDRSDTATEAAIGADASSTISNDMTSMSDNFFREVFVKSNRFHRAFYSQGRVAEIYGPEALEPGGWPAFFADRDILMDRGISVMPGSSRRNESQVRAKLIGESIAIKAPFVGTVIAPEVMLDLFKAHDEALGLYGIVDYEGSKDYAMQMAMENAGMLGNGEDGAEQPTQTASGAQPGGAPPAGGRPSEMTSPDRAGQIGGVNNVGGGRVATGAGQGDNRRFLR